MIEQAIKEQEKLLNKLELHERAWLIFDPDTGFDERLKLYYEDMLARSSHASQSYT